MDVTSKNGKPTGVSIQISETLLVSIIWIVVFIMPVFTSNTEQITLDELLRTWKMLWPFFAIFIVNHFIFLPKLLFHGKVKAYLAAILLTIILFGSWQLLHSPAFPSPESTLVVADWKSLLDGPPPNHKDIHDEIHKDMACPPQAIMGDTIPFPHNEKLEQYNHKPDFANDKMHPNWHRRPKKIIMVLSMVLSATLLAGFDTGLRLAFRMSKVQYQNALLEKQISEKQLNSLKNQVSPHFFMNTLNNIHALVDIDSEMAQDAIIRLSKLMRYLLYECNSSSTVPLAKEFEFISSYIELMKMRFSDKVKISYIYPENPPEKNIAPLMFISLIENAFKHGISYTTQSFVNIKFTIESDNLLFSCINSVAPNDNKQGVTTKKQGGIGIANTRKQLDLIYGNSYGFKIDADNKIFSVFLTLPL